MATVYITEFARAGADRLGQPLYNVPRQAPLAEQTVAIGGASAQSAVLNAETTLVRVHTDAICSVLFGVNPTATTAKMRMAAGQTEYFSVPANSGLKIAVISNT